MPTKRRDMAFSARTPRFQRVYEVCAKFNIDCFDEAARLLDRLDFQRWRKAREEARRS